ncbi:hypothetical protein V3C99_011974 [Haemonchus contortus]|uniref:Reverse transcriptase domain-containing protein n=1 Tax=Haemonchus contortus TaxID=6289 RepID=A0A7I4Y646_HAECO
MNVITEELVDGPLKTILYADDIAPVAKSKEGLQDKLQKWQKVLADNGLRLNVKMTKFLSSEECTESNIEGHREAIEKVQNFRYPGSDLAADGSVDQDVKSQLNAAGKCRESTADGLPSLSMLRGGCPLRMSVVQDSKRKGVADSCKTRGA